MPVLPKHLQAKPQTDTRKHPIKGMTYRVRDKDWAEIWGENLTWEAAEKLVVVTVSSLQSRTARTEAEDIPCPPTMQKAALKARQRAVAAGRVEAHTIDTGDGEQELDISHVVNVGDQPVVICEHCGSVMPADVSGAGRPYVGVFSVGMFDTPITTPTVAGSSVVILPPPDTNTPPAAQTPADVAAAAQLKGIHGGVLSSVANSTVADAQKRADEAAAAKRREKYRLEREQADRETKRLAAEADRLDAELDGANVPESDIDDLIGGTGSMPTDEEIRKAKEKAAQEAAKQKSLR